MLMRLLSPGETAEGSSIRPEKFEVLLERLEAIVQELEGAELPLEKLLARYEEGMQLVQLCGDRLTESEQKVEILSKSSPPEPLPSAAIEEAEEDENIRLF